MSKYLSILLCALSFLSPCVGAAEKQEPLPLRLFRETVRQTPGNVAFSPSSLEGVLRMLQRGAQGATAAELSSLGIAAHPPFSPEVKEAEALFVDVSLEPELKASPRRNDIITLPLLQNPKEAAEQVNSWVSGRTSGMIRHLVSERNLQGGGASVMLAVNAVALKARWAIPFDPDDTDPAATFYCADGQEVEVPMMILNKRLTVAQGIGWKAVALFYEGKMLLGTNTCLVAVLPDGNAREFAAGLTAAKYAEICRALKDAASRKITLGLPRFTISGLAQSYKPVLQACGLNCIFSPQADFRGFADLPLYVGDVFQNCFVEVDESGTRAAASTGAIIVVFSAPRELPERLIFDRPFIWVIVNLDAPEFPYFMGLFEHP